jgi:hypothetical protein
MILRVRFEQGRPIRRQRGKNRHVALAMGSLLIPAALMAYVLALWRLGSDMGVAGEFPFSGLFSHWQVWIGVGAALQLVAYSLNRYGRSGRVEVPSVLTLFPNASQPEPEQRRAKQIATGRSA